MAVESSELHVFLGLRLKLQQRRLQQLSQRLYRHIDGVLGGVLSRVYGGSGMLRGVLRVLLHGGQLLQLGKWGSGISADCEIQLHTDEATFIDSARQNITNNTGGFGARCAQVYGFWVGGLSTLDGRCGMGDL